MRPSLLAGLVGSVVSGVPSTVVTVLERGDPLEGARAVGRMVLPREERTLVLLAAGAPVHGALSLGWAAVLAALLPDHDELLLGAVGGLGIAALDLGVIARFIPPVATLPQGRQWADHVVFGLSVGAVLRKSRHARDRDRGEGRPGRPAGAGRPA
jgi:hypothetical protein